MTSPFDPPPGSTPPPPPPPQARPPLSSQGTPSMFEGFPVPPPPQTQGTPPPGYQAYSPSPNLHGARAGFGLRLGGWLLDALLYTLVGSVLITPGFTMLLANSSDCVNTDGDVVCTGGDANGAMIALSILLMAAGLLIVLFLYVRALGKKGQTWGRKLVGIKVVDEMTGDPIGYGKAFGRLAFAGMISGQCLYLGYLWMLWDEKRQTWHDKVVGSVVVRA